MKFHQTIIELLEENWDDILEIDNFKINPDILKQTNKFIIKLEKKYFKKFKKQLPIFSISPLNENEIDLEWHYLLLTIGLDGYGYFFKRNDVLEKYDTKKLKIKNNILNCINKTKN